MTGLDLYKELIDALVGASHEAYATWVRRGEYPDIPENEDINALLTSPSDEQRDVVARMIQQAKVSGIHDVIVVLLDEGGYGVSKAGQGRY